MSGGGGFYSPDADNDNDRENQGIEGDYSTKLDLRINRVDWVTEYNWCDFYDREK